MTSILVMAFWCKCKVLRESWITEECTEAGNDFAKVEMEGLPTNRDFFTLEPRVSWHLFIDDTVELPSVVVRESQAVDHLSQPIVNHQISFALFGTYTIDCEQFAYGS
jgi:hypothetical protein